MSRPSASLIGKVHCREHVHIFHNENIWQRCTCILHDTGRGVHVFFMIECTAKAYEVALCTVYNIQSQFKGSGGTLCTPEKRYTCIQRAGSKFNWMTSMLILVHEVCTRKQYLTLDNLLALLKTRDVFSGGRTTL